MASAPILPQVVRPPLADLDVCLDGEGWATDYAESLLHSLGAGVRRCSSVPDNDPAIAWALSGAMALTGAPQGPALMCPAPLASCLDGALAALRSLSHLNLAPALPDSSLLGERAAIAGLSRAGQVSPGGACRLLPTADGWIAVSLARESDWELVPAWLECEPTEGWPMVAEAVAGKETRDLIERGRLLGLALAPSENKGPGLTPWFRLSGGPDSSRTGRSGKVPIVIDLSALWAGPLCAQLLQALGARVIKVESIRRPDGARNGPEHFYHLMNAGKASVALDFSSPADRERLRCLLLRADIVIEASRPRALRQLGIDVESILECRPDLTWVSITGYGRSEPQSEWIAYGDDAGVSAGLSAMMLDLSGQALFCGDAIGDPLTGVHAALAAWSGYRSGAGGLFSMALNEVVSHCMEFSWPEEPGQIAERWRRWQSAAVAAGLSETRAPVRPLTGRGRLLGADTTAALTQFDIPC